MPFIKKILNHLKKHKIRYVSVLIFVLLFIVLLISRSKKEEVLLTTPTPTPQDTGETLSITSIFPRPSNEAISIAETSNAISLFFSEPVDPTTVVIQTNSQLSFKVSATNSFPNRILVSPNTPWTQGIHKITLSSGVTALGSSKTLKEDFSFSYTVTKDEEAGFTYPF